MLEKFYIGWNQPNAGASSPACFSHSIISVNRLLHRRSSFNVQNWILDSGAFTRLIKGKAHLSTRKYAAIAQRFAKCGNLEAVVTQDYLPQVAEVETVHRLTLLRYQNLRKLLPPQIYVMPVFQGITPRDYLKHLELYREKIEPHSWVGVGGLVNKTASHTEAIIESIFTERPDLKLHAFGVKLSQLKATSIGSYINSCDSTCGSFYQNTSSRIKQIQNNIYQQKVLNSPIQTSVFSYRSPNEQFEKIREIEYKHLQQQWDDAYGITTKSYYGDDNFETPWN